MRKFIYIFIIALGIHFQAIFLCAKTIVFEDSAARAIIGNVVDKTFQLNYPEALSVIDSLKQFDPEHAIIPLLQAGVYYCRMVDYEDRLDMDEFDRLYDLTWERSETLKKSGEIAEAELYFGMLLGLKATLFQREGKWWSAIRYGLKAVGHLKKCIKADSSYVDAYLGIGSYKYWRSRATDFINWMILIPDEKDKGIEMVRSAAENGLIGREIARSTLAWLLIDDNQPVEAIKLSIKGLEKYPGSRFYLWTLANGYYKTGKVRYAEQVYQQIFDSIQTLERNNHYNELGVCRKMAYILKHRGYLQEALEWVERGLSYNLDEDVRDRRKKTIKQLEKMKIELQAQIDQEQSVPPNH